MYFFCNLSADPLPLSFRWHFCPVCPVLCASRSSSLAPCPSSSHGPHWPPPHLASVLLKDISRGSPGCSSPNPIREHHRRRWDTVPIEAAKQARSSSEFSQSALANLFSIPTKVWPTKKSCGVSEKKIYQPMNIVTEHYTYHYVHKSLIGVRPCSTQVVVKPNYKYAHNSITLILTVRQIQFRADGGSKSTCSNIYRRLYSVIPACIQVALCQWIRFLRFCSISKTFWRSMSRLCKLLRGALLCTSLHITLAHIRCPSSLLLVPWCFPIPFAILCMAIVWFSYSQPAANFCLFIYGLQIKEDKIENTQEDTTLSLLSCLSTISTISVRSR